MARIEALPANLRDVPEDQEGWLRWRDRVAAYRTLVHGNCRRDDGAKADAMALSKDDPAYFLTVFGVVFEPRGRPGVRRGWNPWILMHPQVNLLRWIEAVMAVDPDSDDALLGRADGVAEKDRDMGGSYTFCGYAACRWLFDDDAFAAGFVALKGEKVDDTDNPDSLFYKIEGNLGLDPRVPDQVDGVPTRLPAWLVPEGYDPALHNLKRKLVHPYKPNYLLGELSTETAGVGGRATMRVNDECSKWEGYGATYSGQSAVTDHRFSLSSADNRFGPGFQNLARSAREAAETGGEGPSYLLLDWFDHPFHTDRVFQVLAARHKDDPAGFRREYRHDYAAGGDHYIYKDHVERRRIAPEPLAFDPTLDTELWIDPGVASPTAFHWVQYRPEDDDWWLLESYLNVNKDAGFYASIVTGILASGMGGYDYDDVDHDVMETARKAWNGRLIGVGDPYGAHRGAQGTGTFYDDLNAAVSRLTGGVGFLVRHDYGDRGLAKRHEALRALIGKLRVNDTPRTRRTLEALKEHKTKDYGDRELVNPSTEPVRFWGHDLVTALEFGAVHRQLTSSAKQVKRAPSLRVLPSGKPMPLTRSA